MLLSSPPRPAGSRQRPVDPGGAGGGVSGAVVVPAPPLSSEPRGRGRVPEPARLPPPENFLYQEKWDCYLPTGTGGVRFVWRGIYAGSNHHFRQRPGVFEAERSWGARHRRWNKDPTSWRRSAAVDTFCRHNYGRSIQPKVKVSPTKSGSPPHPHLLVCSVTGFYPSGIEIKWLKNGQEQTAGVVSTELLQNGDWTFQILVMLEMSPRRGDVYTCQVEHISLQGPLTAQSDSARSKMLTGVGGFMLGLIFLAPGLLIYLKNKKGERLRAGPHGVRTPGLQPSSEHRPC
uniref:Ig-like domain-containing protein n=1 Tax=Chelonoidis abingdonii TaxID=106734 RepID=A0A8C0GVB3_CHEAB